MACKLALLFALLAVARAGYVAGPAYAGYSYGAPYSYSTPAIVSHHGNILRSHGNLGQLSTYSKSISTPYSSVTKYDTRLSNDALVYAPYAQHYAASPAYSHSYSAPVYSHTYSAPAYAHGYAAPGYGFAAHAPASLLGVAYSTAPASAHFSYSNGYGLHYSY